MTFLLSYRCPLMRLRNRLDYCFEVVDVFPPAMTRCRSSRRLFPLKVLSHLITLVTRPCSTVAMLFLEL